MGIDWVINRCFDRTSLLKEDMNKLTYPLKKIISKILFYEIVFAFVLALLYYFSFVLFSETDTEKLLFKYPIFGYFLLLIPFYYLVIISILFYKNKQINKLGNSFVLSSLLKEKSSKNTLVKLFLIRNILFFLVIGMMQPLFGSKKAEVSKKSLEIVLAIDISNSMNTKDVDPNFSRLQIIKRSLIQLINSLNGDKIGICVFANGAYVQLPVTLDYGAAKMFVNEIETDMVSNQGTNIAAALTTSNEMFSKDKANKAIVLVTDGENHTGSISEIVAILRENKVFLAVLGIGSTNGGKVPNHPKKPELGFKQDENGKAVISKLNKKMIQQIAKESNGVYEISNNSFPDLSSLLLNLQKKSTFESEVSQLNVKENYYPLFLFLALVFLVFYVLYKER